MRNIIILVAVIAGVVVLFPQKTKVLMHGDGPFIAQENSGYTHIDPEAEFATNIRDFAEPGLITIVEFHDDACAPCHDMVNKFDRLLAMRPDVSVKLIHMTKNYYRFWGEKYGLDVPHIPFTVLLDSDGEIVAADDGFDNDGYETLFDWINAEIQRDWEKNNS